MTNLVIFFHTPKQKTMKGEVKLHIYKPVLSTELELP